MDLSTKYLGLRLRTPIVASSSPLCRDLDALQQMEQSGAAAVVLHSLFEEQLNIESQRLDNFLNQGSNSFPEASSYFPDLRDYDIGPRSYLDHLTKAKKSLSIPVIGSLNGASKSGWTRYARNIEEAGADALELNIYLLPSNPETEGSEIEKRYCDLVQAVKAEVTIPVAVKLGPYFSSLPNMAYCLARSGADALVFFNRFYQADFDLETLEVTPNLSLSTSEELRLRLHWVALLAGRVQAELAITGGVHTAVDVLKGVMAGATVVMLTSALLRHGVSYLAEVERDLLAWMEEHACESIDEMRGCMSADAVGQPEAFERTNYLKVLGSYAR